MTEAAAAVADLKFSLSFLLTEWEELVDAWQLQSWESYRDVKRLGRKTRLQESQRAMLWSVLDACAPGCVPKALSHAPKCSLGWPASWGAANTRRSTLSWSMKRRIQRCAAEIPGRARRAAAEQPVFRRRSWPAHFSAAFLLEIAGRGYPRPRAHLAHQLPHFAPDQNAG